MNRLSEAAAVLLDRAHVPSFVRSGQPPEMQEGDAYAIEGRCLLADGSEHGIRAYGMSLTSFDMACPAEAEVGSIVVCHLDGIGIVAGQIVFRTAAGLFRVRPHVDASRRLSVVSSIARHAEQESARRDQRAAPRIVPKRLRVTVKLGEKLAFKATILNVSLTGAAVALNPTCCPFVGSVVQVGQRDSIVVRVFKDGFAVHFKTPIRREDFDDSIVL